MNDPCLPKWIADLSIYLPLKSQFVLTGNIYDRFIDPFAGENSGLVSLQNCIWKQLDRLGYEALVVYDSIDGIALVMPPEGDTSLADWFTKTTGLNANTQGQTPVTLDRLADIIRSLVKQKDRHTALFIDYASRILARADQPESGQQKFFPAMLKLSHEASVFPTPSGISLHNSVFWIAEQENDLPSWFTIGNPKVRSIIVPPPDMAARAEVIKRVAPVIPGFSGLSEEKKDGILKDFKEASHGLLCRDIAAIAQLAAIRQIDGSKISDAARQFKLGVQDDPWSRLDEKEMSRGEETIARRVKGQDVAIQKAMDIIKRALTGLSGAQASRRGGRPRGVLFLAGPTGTGKTELAKSLTEVIFGDQDAYVRFDMSEFSAEHADQRLLGAPPGYVGYDAGGELTNAMKEKPFSVVLFDEIEKAHPRILDKFLQLLDDGVLTSGRGEKVYFSEAIIVFTSNLGITRRAEDGSRVPNVKPGQHPSEVRSKIRNEIARYFSEDINRPELLNRIGENIVVFDFIGHEASGLIFDKMIQGIQERMLTEREITLHLSDTCRKELLRQCTSNLDNGGRGIGNQIEALFINPLARKLFELPSYGKGMKIEVVEYTGYGEMPDLKIKADLPD